MRKSVIFLADSLDNAQRFKRVLGTMDVSVVAGSCQQARRLLQANPSFDLAILEARGDVSAQLGLIEEMLAE